MLDTLNIRLKIEGKLLEVLKEEASKEFRSPTQHVMYLITKHFEDQLSAENSTNSICNSSKVTKGNYDAPENTFNANGGYSSNIHNTNDDSDNTSYDNDVYEGFDDCYSNDDSNYDCESDEDFNDISSDSDASIDDDIANF